MIQSKLLATLLYGEEYYNQLSGNEQRAIALNKCDCRVDIEDENEEEEDEI